MVLQALRGLRRYVSAASSTPRRSNGRNATGCVGAWESQEKVPLSAKAIPPATDAGRPNANRRSRKYVLRPATTSTVIWDRTCPFERRRKAVGGKNVAAC